ncbi:protein of unknown function [Serratia sp. Tan611]|nr:protein of unknown function [Serratia sp. Tan611]
MALSRYMRFICLAGKGGNIIAAVYKYFCRLKSAADLIAAAEKNSVIIWRTNSELIKFRTDSDMFKSVAKGSAGAATREVDRC